MKCILALFVFSIFSFSTTTANGYAQLHIDNDEYICSKLDGKDENQGQINNCKIKCVYSKDKEFKQLKLEMDRKGYTYYNNFGFYKFHSRPVDWLTAQMICVSEGTHLVVLNSQQEATLIHSLFVAQPPASVQHPEQMLIGIHDRNREGYWEAVTGGTVESSGFSSWSPSNPSGGTTENCGTIVTENVWINDFPCQYKSTFMCEKEWDQ